VSDERDPVPAHVIASRMLDAATADAGPSDSDPLLQRVCRAAVEGLSLSGSAIHFMESGGGSGVAAASDLASKRIADLAFATGEGPSTDAFARRRPVLVSDLTGETGRWPGYCELVIDLAVRAQFSLPLQVGGMSLGVLDLYCETPRRLTDADFLLAVAFAELATEILLGVRQPDDALRQEPLLDHRPEIHQAQGMVMVDLGVDLAEALVRMRARAFGEGMELIEVARAILAGATLRGAEEDGAV
jgi:hypothetical protein